MDTSGHSDMQGNSWGVLSGQKTSSGPSCMDPLCNHLQSVFVFSSFKTQSTERAGQTNNYSLNLPSGNQT